MAAHSNIASIIQVSTSYEGRPIRAVKVCKKTFIILQIKENLQNPALGSRKHKQITLFCYIVILTLIKLLL